MQVGAGAARGDEGLGGRTLRGSERMVGERRDEQRVVAGMRGGGRVERSSRPQDGLPERPVPRTARR